MGIVNVLKGLESRREIFNFNGFLKENLNLNWEHTKIYKGSEKLTPDYKVKENDVLIIREYPGASALLVTTIVLGVVTLGVGIGAGIYARQQIKAAEREMKNALDRMKNAQKQQRDVSSIPMLSGARNERADGKNSPVIFGRHLFAPYFLSDPYLRSQGNDGEDLYWWGTFLCGQDGLCFDKVRNGLIDLVTLSGDTPQTGRFEFQDPGGIDPPFYTPENYIEISQSGERFQDDIFNQKWVDSLDSSVELGRIKSKETILTNGDTQILDEGAEIIIRESAKFPMFIELEFLIDGLYGFIDGVTRPCTLDISVNWGTEQNDITRPIDSWRGGFTPFGVNWRITRNSQKQMRFIACIDLSSHASLVYSDEGKPIHIKVERKTLLYTGGYRDRIYLSAIRTRQYNPKLSSREELIGAENLNPVLRDKFCLLGIKLKAKENTQEALDRFNIIASMTGRTWNGSEWSLGKTKTSNPAAVALEVLTGLNHNISKYNDSEVNLYSFGKLYEYCNDQRVNVGTGIQPLKLRADGVAASAMKKLDALTTVLNTCDGGIYFDEYGLINAVWDAPQDVPIALLNPQRIVRIVENRKLNRKADGYVVEYVDENADWASDTRRILRPRVKEKVGENTYSPMKFEFITNYYHAMWLARRMMAKEIHRPGNLNITVGKEGRLYRPGSLIKVQHERFKIGLGSGEIMQTILNEAENEIIGFKLMERFDISKDCDYFIEYYIVDESRNHVAEPKPLKDSSKPQYQTLKLQSVGEYTDVLLLTTPIPIDSEQAKEFYLPAMGNILNVITGDTPKVKYNVYESKRYIVSTLSETFEGFELALVAYNDEIYNTSSIDAITPYMSRIQNTPLRVHEARHYEDNTRILINEVRMASERIDRIDILTSEKISQIEDSVTTERIVSLITNIFANLPDDPSGLPVGSIYRDGNQLMVV